MPMADSLRPWPWGGVQYTYGALGNIQSVQPVTLGPLAIFSFSPD